MKRYYIVYEGQVQGVGFRGTMISLARKYNLTGYVRNLLNGKVEVEVQGEDIDPFLKDSLSDRYFIKVSNYSIKQIPTVDDEKQFIVRFGNDT
jgi:acylphosphatase